MDRVAVTGHDGAEREGPLGRRAHESRSLFGELLDWVLAPLLLLWPMSLALTWLVAQGIASKPYDVELARLAQTLAAAAVSAAPPARPAEPPSVRPAAGYAMTLERAAANVLLRGDDDLQRWYQVLGPRGTHWAGEANLHVPQEEPVADGAVRLRDDLLFGEAVRVAYLWLPQEGAAGENQTLVQVAETLEQRQRLTTDIIKGVLLPQFLILPLAVVLVWFALSRGIRPLNDLQRRIRRRESTDLSPIPERDVPDEVAPLVASINDLLLRLGKSIGIQRQFLADAAHQLKTPLAGLRMQAELAAREIEQGRGDAAAVKQSLDHIASSSQRAAHMVNQLLSMARTENAGQAMRRQWVDLAAITREVVRDFVPRAIERRIDLGYEGPETFLLASNENTPDTGGAMQGGHQPARLFGEPVLLGELVRNLVDNALRYTPAGGTVTARVRCEPLLAQVQLQVEDTGPGIAPSERDLVFQAFYRNAETDAEGSGLGLAIVREVVLRHGGHVSVADAPHGPGALFTLVFPQQVLPESVSR
jgi:two-component system, OmpR family, sensor histidine kinase TctE